MRHGNIPAGPRWLIIVLVGLAGACGGGSGSSSSSSEVRALASENGMDGSALAAAHESRPPSPEEDPLARLGKLLFFSTTLSGNRDVACASCHHPELAGGDGLSLPVGVAAREPEILGPGRRIDPELDLDPRADGGPNVPRNSQTTFNSSLYNRALFHDGRLFVVEDEEVAQGEGQAMRTPESGSLTHDGAGETLLEVQALFPLVSDSEMRGFSHADLGFPDDYREMLVERLETGEDGPGLPWSVRFEHAFPEDPEPVRMENVQRALAAYQASQVFVLSPWKAFLTDRRDDALSEQALEGARLFLVEPGDGGLGCASCHAGERFTDEQFYNVGFPQIGRGKRSGGEDPGRWGATQKEEERFAFRTPSLLNIALRAPYGHAGTFQTLEEVLAWHADPEFHQYSLDAFLLGLEQFQQENVLELYPEATENTAEILKHESFLSAWDRLPGRALSDGEVENLGAFLEALTAPCAADTDCLAPWVPDKTDDPDGNLLVRDEPFVRDEDGLEDYPPFIGLSYQGLPAQETFSDVTGCDDSLSSAENSGSDEFVQRFDSGLDAAHGFAVETWDEHGSKGAELLMKSGAVTPFHFSGDCWPDLVFLGGEDAGLVFYRNLGGQEGFARDDRLATGVSGDWWRHGSIAAADLNGDYRRELLLGNTLPASHLSVLARDGDERYGEIARLPMSRSSWGISLSDYEATGYPGFYVAHWGSTGVSGQAPALWRNEDGERLVPNDHEGGTDSGTVNQDFNFTPSFGDLSGSGWPDLVLASDFETSEVLRNAAAQAGETKRFELVTDRSVITDENGMGGVLADFFNNGKLDWFVNSIYDPSQDSDSIWGVTGNRLYRNTGNEGEIVFEDVTDEAGIREGGWGWGVCAADFNNSGFLDIFHVNGFGRIPDGSKHSGTFADLTQDHFHDNPPVLFINNGDGAFTESAVDWNIDVPSQGTGVACFDYDRDGDVDIVVVDNSRGMQFFENQTGHGPGSRFLNIRLVGPPPNTDALGARVDVDADVGNGHGRQVQMREHGANSTYNGHHGPDLHFGLGEAEVVDQLRVRWPDGTVLVCEDLPVNRFIVLDQRAGEEGKGVCPE